MYAIDEKNLENVKLLLVCGADVEKAKKDGKAFRVPFFDFEKKIFIYFILSFGIRVEYTCFGRNN